MKNLIFEALVVAFGMIAELVLMLSEHEAEGLILIMMLLMYVTILQKIEER